MSTRIFHLIYSQKLNACLRKKNTILLDLSILTVGDYKEKRAWAYAVEALTWKQYSQKVDTSALNKQVVLCGGTSHEMVTGWRWTHWHGFDLQWAEVTTGKGLMKFVPDVLRVCRVIESTDAHIHQRSQTSHSVRVHLASRPAAGHMHYGWVWGCEPNQAGY